MHGPTSTNGKTPAPTGLIGIPERLPLFPLSGVVLLPGEVLPLHIFEPRYRAMVSDAISGRKFIGMVEYAEQNGDPGPDAAAVRPLGCAGLIANHRELPDGRFLIWLLGLERFTIDRELEVDTPYRQAQVIAAPVDADASALAGLQPVREELRQMLPRLIELEEADRRDLERQLSEITDAQLIALTSQILELPVPRKRQLLEATNQAERFMLVFEDLYRRLDHQPDLLDEESSSTLN